MTKVTLLALILLSQALFAQRRSPNQIPPPPGDLGEFEEFEDDSEFGDDFRGPPPPPIQPATNGGFGNPNNPTESLPAPSPGAPGESLAFPGRSNGYTGKKLDSSKVRFELVNGEYWLKGQKRSRGQALKVKSKN